MTMGGLTTFRFEGLRRSRMRHAVGARGGLALGDGDHGLGHGKPGLHRKRGNDGGRNNDFSTSDCHLNLYSAPFRTMLWHSVGFLHDWPESMSKRPVLTSFRRPNWRALTKHWPSMRHR